MKSKKDKILIESMTKLGYLDYSIRVWRQEYHQRWINGSQEEIKRLVGKLFRKYEIILNPYYIASEILKINRVNAVEVLDNNGNGNVLYKNWP